MTFIRRPCNSAILLLALLAIACKTGPERAPEEQAFANTQRVIHGGVQRGFLATETLPRVRVRLRYNPVACDVPDFEIYTHQRWSRVYVDGPRALQSELEAFKTRTNRSYGLEFLEVDGSYSGMRRAQSGARYPLFIVAPSL